MNGIVKPNKNTFLKTGIGALQPSTLDLQREDDLIREEIRNKAWCFKNRIINGDFAVWQRGESFTVTSSSGDTYTADRFFSSTDTDGQFTVNKSQMSNGLTSCKVIVDTPPTNLSTANWRAFALRMEGQHLYDLWLKKANVTISFWFNSNVTGEFSVSLRNTTLSQRDSYVTVFQYTTANQPQKVEVTISLDFTSPQNPLNDKNRGFEIGIANMGSYSSDTTDQWLIGTDADGWSLATNWASSAGNFIEIAQLQLEEGSVATDFEYVPYDIQLLRCMRYYESNSYWWGSGADFEYSFKVLKRVNPTMISEAVDSIVIPTIHSFELNNDTENGAKFVVIGADAELF